MPAVARTVRSYVEKDRPEARAAAAGSVRVGPGPLCCPVRDEKRQKRKTLEEELKELNEEAESGGIDEEDGSIRVRTPLAFRRPPLTFIASLVALRPPCRVVSEAPN